MNILFASKKRDDWKRENAKRGTVKNAKVWKTILMSSRRLLAGILLAHVPLCSTALHWRCNKLLSFDRNRNSLVFTSLSWVELSILCHSRVFSLAYSSPCKAVPRFPVLRLPPLQYGAEFSSLAFYVLAFSATKKSLKCDNEYKEAVAWQATRRDQIIPWLTNEERRVTEERQKGC